MSRWSNKKLTKEELEAKWRLNFLSEYAELKIMYPEGNTIQISDIEKDARRAPTISKYFISLGWADPEESHWSVLAPIDEVVEKVLPEYAEEYDFRYDGKKEHHRFSNKYEILGNVYDAFVNVHRLQWHDGKGKKGLMYIHLHRDEYEIIEKKDEYGKVEKHVYPKKLIDSCDNNILRAYTEEYCVENVKEVLSRALHLKFKYIGKELPSYSFESSYEENNRSIACDNFSDCFRIVESSDKFFFDDTKNDEPITIENKISYLEQAAKVTKGAIREWKILRRIIERLGGNEKFKEFILETTKEIFQENAPLWIIDGNETQKTIAEIVIKGTTKEQETKAA
jgi:hypothetical protein